MTDAIFEIDPRTKCFDVNLEEAFDAYYSNPCQEAFTATFRAAW